MTRFSVPIIPILALVASTACTLDSPAEPTESPPPTTTEVRSVSPAIREMLADPVFQGAVTGLSGTGIGELMSEAARAFTSSDQDGARSLVARAVESASLLADTPETDPETLMYWSVLERYLQANDLL